MDRDAPIVGVELTATELSAVRRTVLERIVPELVELGGVSYKSLLDTVMFNCRVPKEAPGHAIPRLSEIVTFEPRTIRLDTASDWSNIVKSARKTNPWLILRVDDHPSRLVFSFDRGFGGFNLTMVCDGNTLPAPGRSQRFRAFVVCWFETACRLAAALTAERVECEPIGVPSVVLWRRGPRA